MGSESAAWEHHLDDKAGASLTGSASSLLRLLLPTQLLRSLFPSSHSPLPPLAGKKKKNQIYQTVNLSLCKNVTFRWQSGEI